MLHVCIIRETPRYGRTAKEGHDFDTEGQSFESMVFGVYICGGWGV